MEIATSKKLARAHECGVELLRVLGLPIEGVRSLTLVIKPDAPITAVIEQYVSKESFAAAQAYIEEREYVLVRPADVAKD